MESLLKKTIAIVQRNEPNVALKVSDVTLSFPFAVLCLVPLHMSRSLQTHGNMPNIGTARRQRSYFSSIFYKIDFFIGFYFQTMNYFNKLLLIIQIYSYVY